MKQAEAGDVNGDIVTEGTLDACAAVTPAPWPEQAERPLGAGQSVPKDHVPVLPLTMRGLRGLTDEGLMMACRQGRQEALEELYRRHHRAVFAFIFRLVHDRQLAEDLVQETFLRVYGSRKRWQPKSKFTSWLYRIARNLCIDEKRRYWNRLVQRDTDTQIGSPRDAQSTIDQAEDKGCDARQHYTEKVHAEIIRRAVDSLSRDQREVIILNKYHGLSYMEIAEILGVTPESIKQRAYRAHIKLREILQPLLEEY